MQGIILNLKKCQLFSGITDDEIENIIKEIPMTIKNYKKNEIAAIEESPCDNIGILLNGRVEAQMIYGSGKTITINTLGEGDTFGEAIVFSKRKTYPATVAASENTIILFISRENVIKICKLNDKFLNNFMSLLSNRILMLNSKIRNLSFKTVKQRVVNYILEESKRQRKNKIDLKQSKKAVAEYLGIPRPSLSRELINLRDEGIIKFDNKSIEIIDFDLLAIILDE